MVARGRGKKAASATATEPAEVVANGDVSHENDIAGSSVSAPSPPVKKGRVRASKKEVKALTEETIPAEIAEKPSKSVKAAKAPKKTAKGKSAVEAEVFAQVIEKIEEDVPIIENKSAADFEKKAPQRKRKADSSEKTEEVVSAPKKAPKTRTKAAKKETVDSAGVPEDPSVVSNTIVAEEQTNGTKKNSSGRGRGAQKAAEAADKITTKAQEETIVAEELSKKSSKSKGSKPEKKKPPTKTKASRKAIKEEDPAEHDILPEDEFNPEEEDEEIVEEPKIKKIVKSKGSRKQLKDDIPPVAEEIKPLKEDVAEPDDSEVESAIDDKKKSKGKKPTAATATKKPAAAKKVTTKRTAKTKKGPKEEADELTNEEQDIGLPEVKTNGNAKPKVEPAEEKKAGRGRKRAAATPIEEADEADGSKSAKQDILLNPTVTEYSASDFSIDKDFKLKISSWNIAGLRSWLKKDGLQYLTHEQPDVLCLQEIKCTTDQLPEEARIPGYHPYWLCMPGGHAGVAVYSKIMPIHVEYGIGNAEHDDSGRMITAEYEKFYLICVYVPNSGRKLVNLEKRMQWEELFREYVQKLDKIKPVIIAGDMNVSHKEIDLANPKTNTKNAGFTPEERDAMTKLLDLGYVDTFRHFYPDQKGSYSFWSYMGKARSKNVGWRLDYFIISERITSKIVESTIRAKVLGSDHCPITLFLNI